MVRLLSLQVITHTGAEGTTAPTRIRINGHVLPLTRLTGGTGAGERFEGRADIRSVVHSLELLGPPVGSWSLSSVEVHFWLEDGTDYGHQLSATTLPEGGAVNIWLSPDAFAV